MLKVNFPRSSTVHKMVIMTRRLSKLFGLTNERPLIPNGVETRRSLIENPEFYKGHKLTFYPAKDSDDDPR